MTEASTSATTLRMRPYRKRMNSRNSHVMPKSVAMRTADACRAV